MSEGHVIALSSPQAPQSVDDDDDGSEVEAEGCCCCYE